jgi:hypothetical protein
MIALFSILPLSVRGLVLLVKPGPKPLFFGCDINQWNNRPVVHGQPKIHSNDRLVLAAPAERFLDRHISEVLKLSLPITLELYMQQCRIHKRKIFQHFHCVREQFLA